MDIQFENEVRKQWLNSLFIQMGFTVFSDLFLITIDVIIGLGISAASYWSLYYCAYKKRGTAYLKFVIVTTCLAQACLLGLLMMGKPHLLFPVYPFHLQPWFLLYAIAIFGISGYFLVNCHRLRQVNLKRKEMEALHSTADSELKVDIQSMREAKNLNELDSRYFIAIGKWPQCQDRLTAAYERLKPALGIEATEQ